MKQISKCAAQGDIVIRRIERLPDGLKEVKREGESLVIAHSKTGHNHEIRDAEVRMFERVEADPFTCYLQVDGQYADLVHCRPWDTHETLRLLGDGPGSIWEVKRQREHTPEGWRRVED